MKIDILLMFTVIINMIGKGPFTEITIKYYYLQSRKYIYILCLLINRKAVEGVEDLLFIFQAESIIRKFFP